MQQDQKPIVSMSEANGMLVLTLCCVNRTVQIWSRSLGSTGPWFFTIMFPVGSTIQWWYCAVNEIRFQSSDSFPLWAVGGMGLMWLCAHGVARAFAKQQGVDFHSYEPGSGVLNWAFRNWSPGVANLLSDVTVALFLSILFGITGSPHLSGWYLAMVLWLVVVHGWSWIGERRRYQHWVDAQQEARRWSQRVGD